MLCNSSCCCSLAKHRSQTDNFTQFAADFSPTADNYNNKFWPQIPALRPSLDWPPTRVEQLKVVAGSCPRLTSVGFCVVLDFCANWLVDCSATCRANWICDLSLLRLILMQRSEDCCACQVLAMINFTSETATFSMLSARATTITDDKC